MMKFVLPLFMVAASAQAYFYPASSSMYRYGGYSTYYPTYMPATYPTTYIRSGYYYPYTRTHMTMTYPTFMARSDGTFDANVKDTKSVSEHHVPKPVEASVMPTGHHHVPMTVSHVPATAVAGTPVAPHHHHHPGHVAVAVPATFAYGYQPVSVAQAIAAPKEVVPSIPAEATAIHGHRHVPQPVAYIPQPVSYVPAPVTFEYAPSHISSGRVDTAPVGMTGGASFVPAGAVPVNVKANYEPAPVTAHHDTKHTDFEGKKTSSF